VVPLNTAGFMGYAGFLCDKAAVLKDILYYVVSYKTTLIQNYVHTAIIVGINTQNVEVTFYLLENITDIFMKFFI
jgi:hypothetical protein